MGCSPSTAKRRSWGRRRASSCRRTPSTCGSPRTARSWWPCGCMRRRGPSSGSRSSRRMKRAARRGGTAGGRHRRRRVAVAIPRCSCSGPRHSRGRPGHTAERLTPGNHRRRQAGTPIALSRAGGREKAVLAFEREGFNLHAGVRIEAGDDVGRERSCRYGARPPLSLERLRRLPGGRFAYRRGRGPLFEPQRSTARGQGEPAGRVARVQRAERVALGPPSWRCAMRSHAARRLGDASASDVFGRRARMRRVPRKDARARRKLVELAPNPAPPPSPQTMAFLLLFGAMLRSLWLDLPLMIEIS